MSQFFSNIVDVVFSLVGYVVNLVTTPINALINQVLVVSNFGLSMDDIAEACENFFDRILVYANWFLSFIPISQTHLRIIIACWVIILTLPLTVHTVKLAIKWFNAIKIG